MRSVKKVFLEGVRKIHRQRPVPETILIKLHSQDCKKETLAQVFSFKVSEISKNTFFAEHLWTTGSAFSFSEAATGGALCKKAFLKISQNSQKYTFGLPNFQKHVFYRIPLDDCFWLFCAMLLKWGYCQCLENLR